MKFNLLLLVTVLLVSHYTYLYGQANDWNNGLNSIPRVHSRPTDSGKAGENVTWVLHEDGTLVLSGMGVMRDYKRDLPWRPSLITRLIVEEGITKLGNNAVAGCKNLKDVYLPVSLKDIGNRSFYQCSKVDEIRLPNHLLTIGSQAFKGCEKLMEISVPEGVTTIGNEAFSDCKLLRQINLPKSLVTLGEFAFKGDDQLYLINGLPEFIKPISCSIYALLPEAVNSYWQKEYANLNNTIKTETGNLKNPAPEIRPLSKVDMDIPEFNGLKKENKYAFIIANEHYSKIENVEFAINDGESIAKYCNLTLGIPEDNIRLLKDATKSHFEETIRDIESLSKFHNGKMELIFYYAGHGTQDPTSKKALLVPVDALRIDERSCLPVGELYSSLGDLPIEKGIVFLDACFSGPGRSGKMLKEGRFIKEAPDEDIPTGRVVVFSSTTGDQIAMPYKKEGHGMFTYYLLKKLKETKGSVSLVDLDEYLNAMVARSSILVNYHEQTPIVSPSYEIIEDWEDWKLRD